MTQDEKKRRAAEAALEYVRDGEVIGVGTGSTVNFFIDALAAHKDRIAGSVSSSEASTARLRSHGIAVLDLNATGDLGVYVDGADEATRALELIKGGGGALTREKIVAAASARMVVIADESKWVPVLGRFPLPIEVIPMAAAQVARRLQQRYAGLATLRAGVTTDNGNQILDVHGLDIPDPAALEAEINQITGVVTVGLFARRPADILLVGTTAGVVTLARGA